MVHDVNGKGPYDWYATDDYSGQNNDLLETAEDKGKAMLDPYPPGWRVPKNVSWKDLNNNSFPLTESGRKNSIIGYFLSVRLKGFEGGIWVGIDTTGDYRSSTSSKEGMVNAFHFIESIVNHMGNNYRAAGILVRCVSEKSDNNISDDDDDRIYLEIVAENVVDAAYKKKNGNNGSVNYYICLSNTKTEIDD